MKLGWLALVLLCACSSRLSGWPVETLPPCYQQRAEDEQERAYRAALVALTSQGYAITKAEQPEIDAAIGAAEARTSWHLRALPQGAIEISPRGEVYKVAIKRSAALKRAIAVHRCQTLESLRAQTMGATAGGQRGARLLQLYEQRQALHLPRKIAFTAVAAVFAGTGVGLGLEALSEKLVGCDYCSANVPLILGISGAGFLVVGGVLLAVSIPRLTSTVHQHRALGREIKALRETQLTFTGTGVGFRASF